MITARLFNMEIYDRAYYIKVQSLKGPHLWSKIRLVLLCIISLKIPCPPTVTASEATISRIFNLIFVYDTWCANKLLRTVSRRITGNDGGIFISLHSLVRQRLISNFDIERFFNASNVYGYIIYICIMYVMFVFLLDNRFVAVVWEKAFWKGMREEIGRGRKEK